MVHPSRISNCTAERGFFAVWSLSKPRTSFSRPRINERFASGPAVKVSEVTDRPQEAPSKTSRGLAVERYICISL